MEKYRGSSDITAGGTQIRPGMIVYSADGEKVGKVVGREDGAFVVEKGFFFKKDYLCPFDQVKSISGDEVTLGRTMGELRELPSDYWEGQPVSPGAGHTGTPATGITEETRMPLSEEQITAEKTRRTAGEVEIKKEVKTETKHVEVPVRKEQVTVTSTQVDRPAAPGEASFKESTVTVPVEEEEVEIHKRPVVREDCLCAGPRHASELTPSPVGAQPPLESGLEAMGANVAPAVGVLNRLSSAASTRSGHCLAPTAS